MWRRIALSWSSYSCRGYRYDVFKNFITLSSSSKTMMMCVCDE